WGFYDWTYDDTLAPNFGNSTINMSINNVDAANGTTYSAYLNYTLGSAYSYRFAGFGLSVTADGAEVDLSQYTGIEFYVKGSGNKLSLELNSAEYGTNANYYTKEYTTSGTWTKIVLPFKDMTQPSWAPTKDITNVLKRMKSVQFKASSQLIESGWFRVDEIKFVTTDFTAPAPVTGVTVNVIADNLTTATVRISWVPSTSSDNIGTMVLKSTDHYPLTPTDGALIFNGALNNVLDTITKGVTYYYSLFAIDQAGNVSDRTSVGFNTNGGSQIGRLDVSSNIYAGTKLLVNYDYISNPLTLNVYVDTSLVSAGVVGTLVIKDAGVTINTVTFNPVASENAIASGLNLAAGTHPLTVVAVDWNGEKSAPQSIIIRVAGSSDALALNFNSAILPYPSPYNPDLGTLAVSYELNKDGNLDIYIYNILGRVVYKNSFLAGSEGGKAGYNEITVPATDSFGQKWSNGVYIIRLVADRKVIGTGKVLVLR
ncbi:MAG: CIA30 family protein, partial [Candidatus Margulisbacteria bacterium]|nr:CIA30 family protein [Candidatus Margulisiibacteriota bacterium]